MLVRWLHKNSDQINQNIPAQAWLLVLASLLLTQSLQPATFNRSKSFSQTMQWYIFSPITFSSSSHVLGPEGSLCICTGCWASWYLCPRNPSCCVGFLVNTETQRIILITFVLVGICRLCDGKQSSSCPRTVTKRISNSAPSLINK